MKPEATTTGADPGQSPAHRTIISRLAELILWGLFPFALVVVTALTSVILEIRDPELPILITFGGVLAAGLCLLVWPQQKRGLGRKRAALLVALGLAVFVPAAYVASLSPQVRSELRAQAEARDAASRATRAEARREAAVTVEQEAPVEPALGASPEEAQASFLQTHARFMGLANRCDSAWGLMTDAVGTNDIYVAYNAARRGADICGDVSDRLGRLEFSSLIEPDTRRALNRAVDECSLAMFVRKTSMYQAARIFDGNIRPSAVEEFRQRAMRAQQRTTQCMVQYIGAATDGGYEVPSLDGD